MHEITKILSLEYVVCLLLFESFESKLIKISNNSVFGVAQKNEL